MDAHVSELMDEMTLDEYVAARGGLAEASAHITHMIERSGIAPAGRVLEFAAGNCKSAAIFSRYHAVTEVIVNDFSRPLLTEIAPRVISYLDGDLAKFTFLVGDMHELDQLDRKVDLVIGYFAIHHLTLPEHFLHRLRAILAPGGRILCLREPALAAFTIPTRQVRGFIAAQHECRRLGEAEYVYRVQDYRFMAEPDYAFRLVYANTFERRVPALGWPVAQRLWFRPFEIAYVLGPR